MSDITVCLNKSCNKRESCYRANATWNEYWQSVADFKPDDNGECSHYWPIKEKK